ncbi:methyltransferase FkbM [Flammeovirgaceae bacterium 311]|nr:methyltransferase FkbM [Flammeovirgaceae bacterium 311]
MTFKTPLLFLVFNRPDTTAVVFQRIRVARPLFLFIAADGPRKEVTGEREKCEAVRAIVQEIDWPCDVRYLFREENLGCSSAVISAINWFFTHVQQGIILEDDCKPEQSFFTFCERMLDFYANTDQVKIVSGTNYFFGQYANVDDYYFTHYYTIWGWATWKRVWDQISFSLDDYPVLRNSKQLNSHYLYHPRMIQIITDLLDQSYQGTLNAWVPYLVYHFIQTQGLGIMPLKNLVSNIGKEGTHTEEGENFFLEMKTTAIHAETLIMKAPRLGKKYDLIQYNNIANQIYGKPSPQLLFKMFLKQHILRLF